MKSHVFGFALLSAFAIVASAPAQAQNGSLTRSFVSSTGIDTNPCTIAAPCASFAQAYTKIGANGIIAALDPGKYGPITIIGPVTINGNGWAAITGPAQGNAITINANTSNRDGVTLTGLEIDGAGAANNGIVFNSGGSLNVQNTVVQHFANQGICFFPTGTSNLTVSNSQLSDNGIDGIFISPSGSGTITAVIDRVQVTYNDNDGVLVLGAGSTGNINITVYDSVVAGNGADGFLADTSSGQSPTTLMLFHSVSANNGFKGIGATGPGAIVRVANSTVTENTNGWEALTSGVIESYGDNYIDGNGPNMGSLTPGAKQ